MKKVLNFIDTWGLRIVTVLVLLIFFKTCNTNTNIKKTETTLNKRVDSLVSVTNKIQKEIKIEGLRSEKRMIQSTDRKIMDVNRQSEIDKEIEKLTK